MTARIDNRKRSREEDSNDFMPLSKRINNLHLNNNPPAYNTTHQGHQYNNSNNIIDHSSSDSDMMPICHSTQSGQLPSLEHNLYHNHSHQQQHIQTSHNNDSSMNLGQYDPELTVEENPHYFAKNKLLYELHVVRMRRYQYEIDI